MESKGTVFERRCLQLSSRREQTWKSTRPSSLVPEPQTKSDGKFFERKCSQRQKSFRKEISKSSKLNAPRRSSPSRKRGQRPCINYLKRNCTNPSCDCWHPPVCQNYKTESGRRFGEKCVFWHTEVNSQPSKKPKKSGGKGSVASPKHSKQLGCVFQDFEPLKSKSIQPKSTQFLGSKRSVHVSKRCASPRENSGRKASIARSNSGV